MKGLALFVLAVCVASAYSINIEHAESIQDGWGIVADGDGNLHLAALNELEDGTPEVAFNAANDVIFRLFTRRNPSSGQVINLNNAGSVSGSNFVSGHPTRFIIHGWNNNGGSLVNTAIRTAYINRGEFNVITVDWGVGANTINYLAARNRINDVAQHTARLIDWLNQSFGLNFGTTTVIGHSLGGHAAGITGKRVSRGRLNTVFALDPAFPLFSMDRPAERVAPGDANYVEVMHTNAGLLGFDQPIGAASFYPNNGRTQPGCGADVSGNCAHSRAHEFFAESVNSGPGFWGRRCRNYNDILNNNCVSNGANRRMGGEPSSMGATGVFWLATNAGAPFARGNIH